MAVGAEDALYEIRRHASGSHAILHQEGYQGAATSGGGSDAGGGVLSYLSLQGVSKLRERWTRYSALGSSRQRKRADGVALFVSPNAGYVSVTVGNRIIILRKRDGYASPCGVYTRTYFQYLLHVDGNLELSLSFKSLQLEGMFSPLNDQKTFVSSPKIRISPQGKHIAMLDLTGSVNLFALDGDKHTFSLHTLGNCRHLIDVKDISWWTDNVLMLVRADGSISMYSITENEVVSKDDPVLSTPLLEKAKATEGHAFILQSSRYESNTPATKQMDSDLEPNLPSGSGEHQQTEMDKMFWSLVSFSKVTVTEIYSVRIRESRFKEALDFASRYNLDKDEVLKARWLHSDGDTHEIDSYLAKIKDQAFVLSECVNKVGPTEAALRALLSFGLRITDHYKFSGLDNSSEGSTWDSRIIRLRLLRHRDMLETFLRINMGRYSAEEYSKFRSMSLVETAIALAESGKIGALNLIFKRHPYTISSDILRVLSAIPETIAVQTYSQLLPGKSPPSVVILRDGDWVECEQMVSYIRNCPTQLDKIGEIKTEILVKLSAVFSWPSVAELCDWYKNRARDIDCLSGQLENCLATIELACQKGIVELQPFFDDIKCLYQVVYSNELNEFIMNLVTWEDPPGYEKFKIILKGVKQDTVVQRLEENAIPFMKKRFHLISSSHEHKQEESYLVRWLKEVSAENKLSICLAVVENGCGESPIYGLFKDLAEMIETAVHCIYMCSATNQWNTMSSILSKLLHKTKGEKSLLASEEECNLKDAKQALGSSVVSYDEMQHVCADILSALGNGPDDVYHYDSVPYELNNVKYLDMLEKRLKVAEGPVEVGRLFAYYQKALTSDTMPAAVADDGARERFLAFFRAKCFANCIPSSASLVRDDPAMRGLPCTSATPAVLLSYLTWRLDWNLASERPKISQIQPSSHGCRPAAPLAARSRPCHPARHLHRQTPRVSWPCCRQAAPAGAVGAAGHRPPAPPRQRAPAPRAARPRAAPRPAHVAQLRRAPRRGGLVRRRPASLPRPAAASQPASAQAAWPRRLPTLPRAAAARAPACPAPGAPSAPASLSQKLTRGAKKYRGVKWSIHLPNTRRNTIKERKYIQWHENQVSHVWSPIFAKPMLVMAKLRSAMFGVPNIQFSQGRCEWIDWHAITRETDAVCK